MLTFRGSEWRRACGAVAVAFALSMLLVPAASAQEEGAAEPDEAKAWSNSAELGYINTSGNTGTTTLSFGDRFTYNFTYSEFRLRLEFFKATTRNDTLTNVGGGVQLTQETVTTAERYVAEARFRQNLTGEVFWYGLGSWYRNTPSGIDARYIANGGVGYRFVENTNTTFDGEIGIGLTREDQVTDFSESFLDARAYASLRQKLGEGSELLLWGDFMDNLQNTNDLRINARAEVTAQIIGKLALRAWWEMYFDNEPVSVLVDVDPDQPPALYTLRTTDRTLGISLVMSF